MSISSCVCLYFPKPATVDRRAPAANNKLEKRLVCFSSHGQDCLWLMAMATFFWPAFTISAIWGLISCVPPLVFELAPFAVKGVPCAQSHSNWQASSTQWCRLQRYNMIRGKGVADTRMRRSGVATVTSPFSAAAFKVPTSALLPCRGDRPHGHTLPWLWSGPPSDQLGSGARLWQDMSRCPKTGTSCARAGLPGGREAD